MKLSDFETRRTDLRKAVPKHLIMYAGENDIIVISDVPPISEEQYKKLYEISFKERLHGGLGVGDEVDFMPTIWDPTFRDDKEKWYKWVESRHRRSDPARHHTGGMVIRTMTWKQFVEFVKENYPDEDDDFAE